MDILNNETITYDQSKNLARHEDPKVRRAMAKRKDLPRAKGLDFPLDDSALEWQLDFIKNLA